MKPPPFEYVRAESPEHAVALLHEHGDEAKVLAGGQSLVPMMNLRLARPGVLVDVNRIGLDEVRAGPDGLRLGATVRQHQLLEDRAIAGAAPLLPLAAAFIAHPAVRNRGTVCGSLCHADPTAELPSVALALDATVDVSGPSGSRTVPIADFFVSAFTPALEPDELVTGVTFAPSGRERVAFTEIAERGGDFAVAAVAVRLRVEGGTVRTAHVVLAGAESVPVRSKGAEQALVGNALDGATIDEAAHAGGQAVDPPADIHASSAFKRHLLTTLMSRALHDVARSEEHR